MSWLCICETENQDVTPICTVCDCLAPVVQSYLSLEAIEQSTEYNKKLNEIHRLEIIADYNKMLEVALEAMSIYRENGLAIEKAKQALNHINNESLKERLVSLLNAAVEKKNYLSISEIIKLVEYFHLDISNLSAIKSETKNQLAKEKDIDNILRESYQSIVTLQIESAMKLVEEGLEKFPSSKLLQDRRDEINKLAESITELKKKEVKTKTFPKTNNRSNVVNKATPIHSASLINLDEKQKYPKPKRK